MKKFSVSKIMYMLIMCSFVMSFMLFSSTNADATTVKKELRFKSNGTFKVMMFSDIQENIPFNPKTIAGISRILDVEKPDHVIIAGDITSGWISSNANFNTYINQLVEPMESRGISWSHVFGNHDEDCTSATGMNKEQQQAYFESFPNCISQRGPTDIGGVGNYVLPIKASNSEDVVFNLWCLDSNKYLNDNTWYNGDLQADSVRINNLQGSQIYNFIGFPQIMWYWNTSVQMQTQYNHKIPGLMFFHIPLPETRLVKMNPEQTGMTGSAIEEVCNSPINSGLFSTILQRGDVKGVFSGHDHTNTFEGSYCGIRLGYDGSLGYSTYGDDNLRGARIFVLNQANPEQYTTYMKYVSQIDKKADVLDINFDNATVTGNSVNDSSAANNDGVLEGNARVEYDAAFKQNTLVLDGVNSFMRVEGNVPSFNLQNASLECSFKLNSLGRTQEVFGKSQGSDYCLEVGTDNKLSFFVNTGGTYKTVTTAQALVANKVYHAVGTYDGINVKLYLDGQLVGTTACTGAIRIETTTDFLVGADPESNNGAALFLDGKVGLIRIYSFPLAAQDVEELKRKAIPKADVLSINFGDAVVNGNLVDDSSVSNNDGVLEGNAQIAPDAVIGQNALILNGTSSVMRVEGNTPSFNGLQNITVETTFTLDRLGQTQEIFGKSQGSDYCLEVAANNKLSFFVMTGGSYKIATTTQALEANKLYHAVCVYDGSQVKLYLNGALAASVACTGPIQIDNTVDFLVGADPGSNNAVELCMAGKVGLIKIYSFPLSNEDAIILSK